MPLAEELVTSRAFDARVIVQDNKYIYSAQIDVIYRVTGTDEPAWAAEFCPAYGTARAFGATVAYVIAKKGRVLKVGGVEGGVCEVTVTYGPKEKLAYQTGDETEQELDLGVETAHIQEALDQTHYPSSAGDEVGDRIGLTQDGRVEGCDIVVPRCTYRRVLYLDNVTSQMIYAWGEATGKVNESAWSLWQAGEVRFDGAQLRRKGQGKWTVTLTFTISMDSTPSKTLGDDAEPTAINKPGWSYLWFRHRQKKNGDGTLIEAQAISAHVADVYDTVDFATLTLGD